MQTISNRFYLKTNQNKAHKALTNLRMLKQKGKKDLSITYFDNYKDNTFLNDDSRNGKNTNSVRNGRIKKSDSLTLKHPKTNNQSIPCNPFLKVINHHTSVDLKSQEFFFNLVRSKRQMRNNNLSSNQKIGNLSKMKNYNKSEERIKYNPFIFNCLKHSYDKYMAHKNLMENQSICDTDLLKISKWPSDYNNQDFPNKEYYFIKIGLNSKFDYKLFHQNKFLYKNSKQYNNNDFINEKLNKYQLKTFHANVKSFNHSELGLQGITDNLNNLNNSNNLNNLNNLKDLKDLDPSISLSYKASLEKNCKIKNHLYTKISNMRSKEGTNFSASIEPDFKLFLSSNPQKYDYIKETNFYNCKNQSQNSIIQKPNLEMAIKDSENKQKNNEFSEEKGSNNNENKKIYFGLSSQNYNKKNEKDCNINGKLNKTFELLSTKKAILEKESSRFNSFKDKVVTKKPALINNMSILYSGKYKYSILKGNNSELVKSLLDTRTGWVEIPNQINLYNFRWQPYSNGFKYEFLNHSMKQVK